MDWTLVKEVLTIFQPYVFHEKHTVSSHLSFLCIVRRQICSNRVSIFHFPTTNDLSICQTPRIHSLAEHRWPIYPLNNNLFAKHQWLTHWTPTPHPTAEHQRLTRSLNTNILIRWTPTYSFVEDWRPNPLTVDRHTLAEDRRHIHSLKTDDTLSLKTDDSFIWGRPTTHTLIEDRRHIHSLKNDDTLSLKTDDLFICWRLTTHTFAEDRRHIHSLKTDDTLSQKTDDLCICWRPTTHTLAEDRRHIHSLKTDNTLSLKTDDQIHSL